MRYDFSRNAKADVERMPLSPLPASVVGQVAKPFDFTYAYYAGEDEAIADNEATYLEAFAHQKWLHDKIDNPEYPENEDWEPSIDEED